MNSILVFFEEMPIWMRLFWVVGVLGIFWLLEGYYALVRINYKKWKHAWTNFTIFYN